MVAIVALGAWGASALSAALGALAILAGWPSRLRVGLAAALAFFGMDHLLTPER